MADVTVPTAPPLSRIANVELIHTGTWPASTGVWTVSTEDIAAAIAAIDCPAVRRPILKLGHTDPRFDGEPAVGYVSNVAATDSGHTMVGDYEGMPGWLGDVIASAYPDRSVEGEYDYRCVLGHTHPFVITAVALLGVATPAIGTLDSLQDVGALFGVVNAHRSPSQFTVHARVTGGTMPNPQPRLVAATVTSEDVRRAFYEGAPWEVWIEEIQLDPLQLIVVNDNDGERSRVPIILDPAGDGSDAVTFGSPVPVVVRYEDVPAEDAKEPLDQLAAKRITYASRAESRPAATTSPAEPVDGNTPTPTPEVVMAEAVSTLREGLLSRLGVTDADIDDAGLFAALEEALTERADPPTPTSPAIPVLPEGVTVIDTAALEELQVAAAAGQEARRVQLTEERDGTIHAAVRDGRIPVARREHWQTAWDKDPDGAKAALASLAPGLVPVQAKGAGGGEVTSQDDADLAALGFTAAVEGANV